MHCSRPSNVPSCMRRVAALYLVVRIKGNVVSMAAMHFPELAVGHSSSLDLSISL